MISSFRCHKISTWLILLLACYLAVNAQEETEKKPVEGEEGDSKDLLVAVESKDQKVILNHLNRLNNEGTFVFGYEADDGTVKIENKNDRDVETLSSEQSNDELNKTTPIPATTRRPSSLIYPHVTLSPSSTRSPVIQAIPRRRITTTSSTTIPPTTTSADYSKPLYGHYIRQPNIDSTTTQSPSPSSRVVYATSLPPISSTRLPQLRQYHQPIGLGRAPHNVEGQLSRPLTHIESTTNRPEASSYIRRILVSKQPTIETTTETHISSSPKSVLEELSDKEQERNKKPTRNTFRRQLPQEKDNAFDAQQHILNYQQSAGDDTTDIYGSSIATGTQRPLFTTTPGPRVIPAPQSRQISINQRVPIQQYSPTVYKNIIRVQRPNQENDDSTSSPSATEQPIPVLQIPANREPQDVINSNQQIPFGARAVYRQRSNAINRIRDMEYLREIQRANDANLDPRVAYVQNNQPPYDNSEQYAREINQHDGRNEPPPVPILIRGRRPRPVPVDDRQVQYQPQQYQHEYQQNPPYPIPQPIPVSQPNYLPYPPNDIVNGPEEISPPVSVRDFQRLLSQLLYVQSRLQQLTGQNYLDPRLYNQQVAYNQRYQNPYPPQPIPVPVPNRYGPVQYDGQVQNPRNRAYAPVYPNQQQDPAGYDQHYDNRYLPQRRYFTPHQPSQYEVPQGYPPDYLPPEIREMLLLRMLQLAISSELAATNNMEVATQPPPKVRKSSQVRNVKILGEENERPKPTTRSKRYPEEDMQYYE